MNKGLSYDKFYEILLNLREEFHKTGRLDDSNAKLDEILKLLLTSYSLAKENIRLNIEYLRKIAKENFGNEYSSAQALKFLFSKVSKNKEFLNDDGSNIFGDNPELSLHDSENEFADILVNEISKIDFLDLLSSGNESNFDIVNECFGHFVRENFRNNKEDGQYMTPAEVSKYLGKIIAFELLNNNDRSDVIKNLKMLDPTCGVGTLLMETLYALQEYCSNDECIELFASLKKNRIFGQDKVDRMVRMSKINFLLDNINLNNVHIGNSIVGKSYLDELDGKVNLIISNPPFGAEFNIKDLDLNNYPFVKSISDKYKIIKSEILVLDRSIKMLTKNGLLAIVLPDSVVSSKGIYSDLRDYLLKKYDILWVIDLPSVTFAQAGTRTNTSILVIRKAVPHNESIKMLSIKDVGYDVKERVGVPVKILKGTNELEIIDGIDSFDFSKKIILEEPSLVVVDEKDLINNILKPSFYDAKKIKSLSEYTNGKDKVFKLKDFVESNNSKRKSFLTNDTIKHVSVLHVDKNGIIDFAEVENFVPVCKGREIFEGDIIYSKLNPRISRVAVVPQSKYKLVCSNEFEILIPKKDEYRFLIAYFLKTDFVLKQIETLTSGTSSSHSRIQREQLMEIVVPNFDELLKDKKIANNLEKLPESVATIYKNISFLEETTKEVDAFSKK